MKIKLTLLCLLFCSFIYGQFENKSVLFIGNSYTYVNDLPRMIADVAASVGDTLRYDSNAPGGYRLLNHSTNATTLAKIAQNNWDYVVLQEQSQFPSFPDGQVETDVFPYAHFLDSLITVGNECTETVFYMTWGRKNGDASNCASWPPVCTYDGMDSLLNLRYRMMADSNQAIVSPVGAVWKHLRQNFPLIELYQADESHPSVAGTYAAACCFYAVLFRKDPTLISFNSSLSAADAANIRAAAKLIVYDSLLNWQVGKYDPIAEFTYTDLGNGEISFTNNSLNFTEFYWSLAGDTSTAMNPTHQFNPGLNKVLLTIYRCGFKASFFQMIFISTIDDVHNQETDKRNFILYPNPASQIINLKTDLTLLGEFYSVYDNSGKAVLSGKINSENMLIGIENLTAGLYWLCVGDRKRFGFSVLKR